MNSLIHIILIAITASQTTSLSIEGSWYYCDEGVYNEIHFRRTYIEWCPEYNTTGFGYPYKVTSDTLIYSNLDGSEDLIKRRFIYVNEDQIMLFSGVEDETAGLTLTKMEETIIIPDVNSGKEILEEYELEFQERKQMANCNGQ